jgi:enoyl-CoA hydratase
VSVDLERRERIAILTLNRPDALNALSVAMLDDLDSHLNSLENDPETRALVLTGAGDRAFTAGADINHMRTAPLEARDYARRGHSITNRLESFPKPVIAAVNG